MERLSDLNKKRLLLLLGKKSSAFWTTQWFTYRQLMGFQTSCKRQHSYLGVFCFKISHHKRTGLPAEMLKDTRPSIITLSPGWHWKDIQGNSLLPYQTWLKIVVWPSWNCMSAPSDVSSFIKDMSILPQDWDWAALSMIILIFSSFEPGLICFLTLYVCKQRLHSLFSYWLNLDQAAMDMPTLVCEPLGKVILYADE